MSDINLDFTVSNNSIDFTVQPNDITITPSDIQLSFYNGGAPLARGANTEVQYNNEGLLEGSPNFTFNDTTNQLSVGQVVTSNLIATGNVAIGNTITSIVTITANTFASQFSNLGNVANVKIGGGTNGYVLQTDGTGNLDWAASGGGGNGSPGGSNTQIQYNDAGVFGGNAGFTFNEITGNVAMPGGLNIAGNANAVTFNGNLFGNATTAGTVTNGAQPNISSLGTLSSLSVSGNISTTGTTSIQQAKEKITINPTGATGTINFDLLTSAIQLETANATANFTLNFRGNSTTTLNAIMSNNESITCTFINKNGLSAYLPTSLTIDGSSITPLWSSPGTPSPGTPVGYDVYTFNLIKTATSTYTVFASRGGYL